MSGLVAFRGKNGGFTLEHFAKSFDFYTTDLLFTLAIVVLSTVLIGLVAIAIAGYLTPGENPRAVSILRWLYRWPLFIPFVVAGQVMRTFLAKNGMLNHVLIGTGLIEPLSAQSLLDWRGIVVAFVWKQAPFVTLLLAGAMAAVESQHIEAARNLAARWYFPNKLPLEFGLTYWYRVFQPRGNALASLGTSVWIAVLTVAFSLAVAIPAGYALARLKLQCRG